jgi:hypothetical protein
MSDQTRDAEAQAPGPFPSACYQALRTSWSPETNRQWSLSNPAQGQCSVTALVVQDVLGGDILKTTVQGSWHFYNLIEGQRWDFTVSQFAEPIGYADTPSTRDEALADTSAEQYRLLRDRVIGRVRSAGTQ